MRHSLAAILLVAVAAGGCGGNDGGGGEPTTDLSVAMTDFAFEPADVTVPAGAETTVTLDNIGSVVHDWLVLREGRRIEAEADLPDDAVLADEWVLVGDELERGNSATLTFTAPAEGVYQVICKVPGHFSAGMRGEMTVVAPS